MSQPYPYRVDEQGRLIVDATGKPMVVDIAPAQPPVPAKSVSGFAKNVAGSYGDLVSNAIAAVAHPIQTGRTMLDVATGLMQKLLPSDARSPAMERQQQTADAMGQYFASRYGSLDALKEAAYTDPVGVLADVSTVLTAGGGVGVKLGQLSRLGRNVVRAAETVRAAGDVVNPLRPLTMAAKPVLEAAGTGIIESTVRPPAAVKRQQNARWETARTIREQRLLSEEAAKARGNQVSAQTEAAAYRLGEVPMDRQQMLANALQKVRDEAAKRTGHVAEAEAAGLDELVGIERDVPPTFTPAEALRYRQNADRMTTEYYKHQDALLPTSPVGMQGVAQAAWGNENRAALRQLSPEIAQQSDLRRRLMLAEAALETAADRPHALTRMLSLGTAGAVHPGIGAGMWAMDSPLAGASLGAVLDVLAKLLAHPETRTQLGMGRLAEVGANAGPTAGFR